MWFPGSLVIIEYVRSVFFSSIIQTILSVPEFHQLSREPNRTRVADFHRRSGILLLNRLQAPCPEEIIF